MEQIEIKNQIDKIRGSLIGGAIGDALGYPVEFFSYDMIQSRYGTEGIVGYETDLSGGKALISDDTQMTLFTACGILNAKQTGMAPVPSVCEAYIEWYYTQIGMKSQQFNKCWISAIPELNEQRAPGNTCICSLREIVSGRKPENNSKGCGGVMRIAPIPLYAASQCRLKDIKAIDLLAADVSKLTHQHPLGYIPSALLSHIIYRLSMDETPTRENMLLYIHEGIDMLYELFPDNDTDVDTLVHLVEKAVSLAGNGISDVDNIEFGIGEGWVADETLAIAIYCSLAHFENFEAALVAAVNHNGDSDSTGAVTGNIMGTIVGYDSIPQKFKVGLELQEVVLQVADDLYWGRPGVFKPASDKHNE